LNDFIARRSFSYVQLVVKWRLKSLKKFKINCRVNISLNPM
jgi:hypothetical protein